MRVLIQHRTKYEYERAVYLTPHMLRLKPAAHSRTAIEHFSLVVAPDNFSIHWQQDPAGNFLARLDFNAPVHQLQIDVHITANLLPVNPFDFLIDETALDFPFAYDSQLKKDLCSYLDIVDNGPLIMQWLDETDLSKRETVSFLIMLNQKVREKIAYNIRMEPGVQTSDESLGMASGSCRDSAWLLVQICRHLGLAARFVSGYLVQLADAGSTDQSKDSAALHAWAEVYVPGAGWIGLDATSGLLAGEGHIPLACSSGPDSAAPVTGTSEMNTTVFTYSNTVTRLN